MVRRNIPMKKETKLFIKVSDESKLKDKRTYNETEYATIEVKGKLYDCVKQGDKWLAYQEVVITEVEV